MIFKFRYIRHLEMHPAVKMTRDMAKAYLMRGEIVKAEITRQPDITVDEKEIMRHCRVFLSFYKLPGEIEFVERLPPLT
jgi:long-chain acyl-CoA synthetase